LIEDAIGEGLPEGNGGPKGKSNKRVELGLNILVASDLKSKFKLQT